MTRRNRPEQALQKTVAQFLGTKKNLALPADAVWFHPFNGGARSRVEAAIYTSLGVKPGVPDLIIIYRGRVVAIELKSEKGRLSPAQKAMHEQLMLAGATVYTATSLAQVEDFLRTLMPLRARAV